MVIRYVTDDNEISFGDSDKKILIKKIKKGY